VTKGEILQFPGGVPEAKQALFAALEALLFASGEPVSLRELTKAVDAESTAEVREALLRIQQQCEHPGRGVRLVEVAGAWQLQTSAACAEVVAKLRGAKPKRLSSAAAETLSVIAYRQPVTKSEIDNLRGADSGGVLRGLLERQLVRVSGRRRDIAGRPLEYSTARGFLELFSLKSLADLPTLAERDDLLKAGEEVSEE
jgi:segregation and condensation protein B